MLRGGDFGGGALGGCSRGGAPGWGALAGGTSGGSFGVRTQKLRILGEQTVQS